VCHDFRIRVSFPRTIAVSGGGCNELYAAAEAVSRVAADLGTGGAGLAAVSADGSVAAVAPSAESADLLSWAQQLPAFLPVPMYCLFLERTGRAMEAASCLGGLAVPAVDEAPRVDAGHTPINGITATARLGALLRRTGHHIPAISALRAGLDRFRRATSGDRGDDGHTFGGVSGKSAAASAIVAAQMELGLACMDAGDVDCAAAELRQTVNDAASLGGASGTGDDAADIASRGDGAMLLLRAVEYFRDGSIPEPACEEVTGSLGRLLGCVRC
jgi:hypothetical protein